MTRLVLPACVLLTAAQIAGNAAAQPTAPAPVDPPEILRPSALDAPGPAPAPAPAGPPVVVGDTTVETGPPARPRRRSQPALAGAVGLLRTSAADAGDPGELRLGLTGEWASAEDFLVKGSRNRRLAGTLALGVTVVRQLELFGALLASSNRNERCATGLAGCQPEPDRLDPPIIRAFGDVVLGAKLAAPVNRSLRLGVESGLRLYAGSGGLSFDGGATSLWLSALGSWDLRQVALPLVLHLNAGFFKDNSTELQDAGRFSTGMLGSRQVATFAYGIGRDRLRTNLAVAAPVGRRAGGPTLEPFIEYHLELITDAADPAYRAFAPPHCVTGLSCAGNRDQQWLSFGLRGSLASGFAALAAVDLAVRSPGYPFGSALLPFNVLFGVRQSLGTAEPPRRTLTRTVTLERRVVVQPPPARGQARVTVTAPGFQPQVVTVPVTDGQVAQMDVALAPAAPRLPEAPPPAPLRLERGQVVTSAPIVFDPAPEGRASLAPEARAVLDELARQLVAEPRPARIRIEAHWDSGLGRQQAAELTRQQAEAVAAYLVERGVPRERLEPVGVGATRPRAPNLSAAARARNRRVELHAVEP